MSSKSIESLRAEDSQTVAQIFARLGLVYGPQFNWNLTTALEELQKAQTYVYRNAKNGIDGFICNRVYPDRVEVMAIGVDPDAQGQGVAKALLIHTQNDALSKGLPIWLEVHAENYTARGLYLSLGFTCTGERKGYYQDGAAALLFKWS